MHAMKNNAHALPGSNEGGDTNEEADQGEDTPSAAGRTERDDNGSDQATDDTTNTKAPGKDNARSVAVANGPADKVRMGLAAKGPLDGSHDLTERRGVSGVLQGM